MIASWPTRSGILSARIRASLEGRRWLSRSTEGGFGVRLATAAMAVPHRPRRAIARGGRSEDDGGTRPTKGLARSQLAIDRVKQPGCKLPERLGGPVHMIREAVEALGPPGVLPSGEAVISLWP